MMVDARQRDIEIEALKAEITCLRAANERLRAIVQRVYQMSNQREVIEITRAALEASDAE